MERVRDDFAHASRQASRLGFRFLQLHFGHGYLLGTFISPLTNRRLDRFGGGIGNRMRFPLEVLGAARAEFPGELGVAISATDWQVGGLTEPDMREAARLLRDHGADFVTALGVRPPGGHGRRTDAATRCSSRERSRTRQACRRSLRGASRTGTMS